MKNYSFRICLFIGLMSLLFGLIGCKSNGDYTNVQGDVFTSTYNISFLDKKQRVDKVSVDSVLRLVELSLANYDSASVISLINSNKSRRTDDIFRKAFILSKMISDSTQGAFDVTSATLISAWGIGLKRKNRLSDVECDSLLQFVDYHGVWLQNSHLVKSNPNVNIDMSLVDIGIAVDEVVAFLEKRKISNYMVEIGGQVKAKGKNVTGGKWSINIDRPNADPDALDTAVQQVVLVDGFAVSTAGSYRKFFIKDGQKFSYFIDPQTGNPVTHSLLSATVIGSSAAATQGFANAFMVMGLTKSLHYLQTDKTLSAYFISSIGDSLVMVTANGFEKYFQKQ